MVWLGYTYPTYYTWRRVTTSIQSEGVGLTADYYLNIFFYLGDSTTGV